MPNIGLVQLRYTPGVALVHRSVVERRVGGRKVHVLWWRLVAQVFWFELNSCSSGLCSGSPEEESELSNKERQLRRRWQSWDMDRLISGVSI